MDELISFWLGIEFLANKFTLIDENNGKTSLQTKCRQYEKFYGFKHWKTCLMPLLKIDR